MHKTYEPFRIALEKLLRDHSLSSSQLSRMLGHKSKTTLSRIFSGTAGTDSIRKICREVCACAGLALTDEEKESLALAVRVDEVGGSVLHAWDEIRNLFRPVKRGTPGIVMQSDAGAVLLRELTEQVRNADRTEMILINCSSRPLAEELHVLLDQVPMEHLSIRHYMAVNSDPARTAAMIGTLTGLFGFVNYACFSMRGGSDKTGPLAFAGMNCIACRIRTNDAVREFQMMFTGETDGVLFEAPGIYAHWERYLAQLDLPIRPIKTTYPLLTSAGDYVTFTDTYRKLEENRNIYMFKPDICLNQIETDIVRCALLDGARQFLTDFPDLHDTLGKLEEIQEARFHNIFTQHMVTHAIFSPSAIRKFAETGRTSDHFFLLRPYTPAERIRILTRLAEETRSNPYFNIYLLRDEDGFTGMEATCYEGAGVEFIPADTDYNLASGHTEAIITDEEFCELFLRFFREDLLKNHVLPTDATAKFFEDLCREL